MAIQFRCPGCSQPIEVDDIHAEKTAACPYCRHVVTVPRVSSLEETPPIARPAAGAGTDEDRGRVGPGENGAADAGPPPPLHVGATKTPYQRIAETYSRYAVVCTVITGALLIITICLVM